MPGSRRLSQSISEGDGIAIIAYVEDVASARDAEVQGAKALAVARAIEGIREATGLPLLWIGELSMGAADADAVALRLEHVADDVAVETVIEVRDEEELSQVLEQLDPEIFLLSGDGNEATDPLDAVLELLPDVPAGKLAIARVDVANRDEVLALERAGIDAVLVRSGRIADLVGHGPLDV